MSVPGATLIIEENFDTFLSDFVDELGQQWLDQIGIRMLENIDDEVRNNIFLTKSGFPAVGIIDLDNYRKSFFKVLSDNKIEVGSKDPRATDIEFGTTPSQNATLKDSDVISWARRKKIGGRNYVRVGQRIARSIRRIGTAPKPMMARSLDRTAGDNEEVVNRTLKSLKGMLQ